MKLLSASTDEPAESAEPEPATSAQSEVEPLLTPAEIAEYLKVSAWYVNFYARRAVDPLPLKGTARVRRAKLSEIDAWRERN